MKFNMEGYSYYMKFSPTGQSVAASLCRSVAVRGGITSHVFVFELTSTTMDQYSAIVVDSSGIDVKGRILDLEFLPRGDALVIWSRLVTLEVWERSCEGSQHMTCVRSVELPLHLDSVSSGFFLIPGEKLIGASTSPKGTRRPSSTRHPGHQRIGLQNNVLETMAHAEEPAFINEHEASAVVSQQFASFVESRIDEVEAWHDIDLSCHNEQTEIYLLKLNRNPSSIRQALTKGPAMRNCREALMKRGLDWKHDSGALLFVEPWQYHQVITYCATQKTQLRPDNIILCKSMEYLVAEAMLSADITTSAKHRELLMTLKAAGSDAATLGERDTQRIAEWHTVLKVVRTFFCLVAVPDRESDVTASTTQVHCPNRNARQSSRLPTHD